ncbi:MAG: SMP-30/gluconolactonase/LRE family protein [Verrucomicrobiae bacterium]|nr:SMP-30/gluconolactonase/LRE family protein [Verrucomicrobiae bacterium]
MSQHAIIASENDLCGEAPLWDASGGCLYWSDCVGLKFRRYHPEGNRVDTLREGLGINGLAFNAPGGFVVTNAEGIWLWDGAQQTRLIASEVDGAKCQMNDCIADARGRVLGGSYFYDPSGNYPLGKLFSVDPTGRVTILDEGFHLSNGLGFSPDNRTLYFADSAARTIYAYDYDLERGAVANRRVFVQAPATDGLPDGLTVDAEGYVWSAQWYGSCVVRYAPDGREDRRISLPAKQISSVMFGGTDLKDLFVTSAGQPEPMPIMPPGYDPASGTIGGCLYRLRPGPAGRVENRAGIRI